MKRASVLGLLFGLSVGCSGGSGQGGGNDLNIGKPTGTARVNLGNAPPDVGCLVITAGDGGDPVGAAYELSPGVSTTVSMTGLPIGAVTFNARAYAGGCSELTEASLPNWQSDPVTVQIVAGEPAVVWLVMHRVVVDESGEVTIVVDWAECGNGTIDGWEQCDDGNLADGDGCSSACTPESTAPDGWICPAVNYGTADGCDCGCGVDDTDCALTGGACEWCWDFSSGDGTVAYCGEAPAVCGNGAVESGEECDDGNAVDGDGCSASCIVEIEPPPPPPADGWLCDPAYFAANDGCDCGCGIEDTDCEATGGECQYCWDTSSGEPLEAQCEGGVVDICGDGVLGATEECDDGNLDDGDGCSSFCTLEGGSTAPDGWNCPADFYGAADGCDCGCGIADPDCEASGGACEYCWDEAGQNITCP